MATLAAAGELPVAEATGAAAPASERIVALDFVRGAALFGILLMNIAGFGLPGAYSDPTVWGGATGANLWAWIIIQIGFEGTQRALFSMLFGAGVILMTARMEAAGRRDTADIYFRRNLWLIGFGMVNGFLFLWMGDILYAYGVAALFVFAFRKLGVKALLAIGIGTLLLGAAWNLSETLELIGKHRAQAEAVAAGAKAMPEQKKAIEAWQETLAEYKPGAAKQQAKIAGMRGGYASAFQQLVPVNMHMQSWYLYRYFFDVFGMMLIGMAAFRAGVLTLERSTGFYAAMMLGGYAIGLTTNWIETRWILDHGFSVIAMSEANVTYDLGRLATTAGHLGLLLLFVRSGALPWFRHALASVGRMALTNYLTHSVVCAILFVGLGWYGQLERYQLYYVVFAIWAVQLVVSPLWLSYFRFGPVEWLWRYLTYLRRPRFRRMAGEMAVAGE